MSASPASQHGVLVIDKPYGPTSHDIVRRCRKLFGTRQVGHAGTLDPMATGVLVVLLGEACKLSQYLTASDKVYTARVSFGKSTTTCDAEGDTIDEQAIAPIGREELDAALEQERQRSEQIPPAVSAVRLDGERAYRRVRRGEHVEIAARRVRVLSLALLELGAFHADLELKVTKGYYVRSLARDLGAALSVPAHLSQLRRTCSGALTIEDAARWPSQELEAPAAASMLLRGWLPMAEAARRSLPAAVLTAEGELRARQGKRLAAEHFCKRPASTSDGAPLEARVEAWMNANGQLVALGGPKDDQSWGVMRGIATKEVVA